MEVKSTKKIFRVQICAKGAKIRLKSFLSFSQVFLLVSFEIAYNGSLKQFLTFSRGKTYRKILGDPNMSKMVGVVGMSEGLRILPLGILF